MGWTPPVTPASATLLGICDPNGGTLYADAGATVPATVGGNVLSNLDAVSGVTASKLGSLTGGLTLQQDAAGSKYLRGLTTNNTTATTGGGLKWLGTTDQQNNCLFLLVRVNRNTKNVSDLLADIGLMASGSAVQVTNQSGNASIYSGSGFSTIGTLMTWDSDWSLVTVETKSGALTIYRDDEISTTITRTISAASGTGWAVLARSDATLFARADIGLAAFYSGTLTSGEKAAIQAAIFSYMDSLGWNRRPTANQNCVVINGDSNSLSITATLTSNMWGNLIAAQLVADGYPAAGTKVFIDGAGSRQITSCDNMLTNAIFPKFDATAGKKLYLLCCSENDLSSGLGGQTPAQTWARLCHHFLTIKQHDSSIRCCWVSCPPRADQGANQTSFNTNRQTLLGKMASDPTGSVQTGGTAVIDGYVNVGQDSVMGPDSAASTPDPTYDNDHVHFSTAGNARLATGALDGGNAVTLIERYLQRRGQAMASGGALSGGAAALLSGGAL